MTTSTGQWACDTSVAIPALDPNHEAHAACRRALVEYRPALAGHAAFAETCWLDAEESGRLRGELGMQGIVGGAVFDALVGSAAVASRRVLLTRDRRAERTYRALDVEYHIVD